MPEAKHTPTPFVVTDVPEGFANGPAILISTQHRVVATLERDEQGEADAAFLARAANSHEQLLEACRTFIAAFDDLFGQCCSNPITNAWGQQVNLTKLNEANEIVRAALAAAEGDKP